MREIVVSEYDPAWPVQFEEICATVWPAVEGVALRIDHVGSTSVAGLAAKPIIDMDIVVTNPDVVPEAIERLGGAIGYAWRGDLGIPGREAFSAPDPDAVPLHHLYVVTDGNRGHLDHLLLRDLLRGDGELRQRYGALKRANASVAEGDIVYYTALKAAFVGEVLALARERRGLAPVEYWVPVPEELTVHPGRRE